MAVRDFTLVADEPPSAGGEDAGPAPTELLLASLASCFTMAMVYAADRHGVTLPSDLAVTARGHHQGPRFHQLEVEVHTDEPSEAVEGLLDVAARYCYVSNTLNRPPEVSYRLRSAADR